MSEVQLDIEAYRKADEIMRIGRRAVRAAQEESRAMGVPNVYSINGIIYYELPGGELSRTDPYPMAAARKGDT